MMSWFQNQKRIYLDHAAATPLRDSVVRAMQAHMKETFANPSAIHSEGVCARKVIEEARGMVAETLGVRKTDVTFTSGGTESNNIALSGFVAAIRAKGIEPAAIEIISLETEHPSILRTLDALKAEGVSVTYVPVDQDGRIVLAAFEAALKPDTRLVTVSYANSETGVVQDLREISRIIRRYESRTGASIALHTDASQAPLWLPCNLEQVRADMMTLDAGKCGGPKGVGILVHRPRVALQAVAFGGSQESGLRPGTESVMGIVGCATALAEAQAGWKLRSERVADVRDEGVRLLEEIDGIVFNGSRTDRLANNINISIPGIDTEFAVVSLDREGIACSTKSACSGAGGGMSAVVYAMTDDTARAAATIRLTLGEETTKKDMKTVAAALRLHVEKMKPYTNT